VNQPALSTKGYVAAAVIPVLIAAGLFGLVVWNYDDADIQGETAPILLSNWQDGASVGDTTIAGVLEADPDGCPVLATSDGDTPVAWPGGWSATVSPGGTLTVYDGGREPVVREDQEVRATGALVPVGEGSPYAGKRCAPADGTIAEIRSSVEVLG
jgi:hypothetical protein